MLAPRVGKFVFSPALPEVYSGAATWLQRRESEGEVVRGGGCHQRGGGGGLGADMLTLGHHMRFSQLLLLS